MKNYVIFIMLLCTSILKAQEFSYSNYISASNNMNVYGIEKVDEGFLVYGHFRGTMNVSGSPVANGFDVYLIKYNDVFEQQWVNQIGGTFIDFAYDLKVASDGSIYFIGSFTGTCLFEGANQITSEGLYDVFVAKYTSDGSFVWGKNIAFNDADQFGTTIDIDKYGDLIIGGYYADSITFADTSFSSSYGMYYAKLDNSGNFQWAINIPSTSDDSQIQSLSAFSDGYYINGNIKGTTSFETGDEDSNTGTYTDVFLYKTNFSGIGQWLRRTYGDGNALTGTITSDDYDNIYYTGYYGGSQMEVDKNATEISSTILSNNGSLDIFVLKYNKEGNLIWVNNYGLQGEDFARDIKYQNGFLYITGYFSDTIQFGSDTLLSGSDTDLDAFLGMIDADGNTLKGIKVNDSNDGTESGMELSSDDANNAYWGGYFNSTNITIGDSTFNNPNPGKRSVFISKYKPPYVATFTKKKNVTCSLGSDGELIVTPYFGVLPYTYSWSHDPGLNDSTATGLAAGTYSVTVTDALDSTAIAQHTLTEPDSFYFNPLVTHVNTCSYSPEGAIDISVTGGNGGNTYYWFESEGGSGVALTSEDQVDLTPGTYSVTVTDEEGCTADTTIQITGPEPITFGGSVVTSYTGPLDLGAVDLMYQGGTGTVAFSWEGPSGFTATTEDITDLDPGSYSVTTTDNNGCAFDTTFNVLDETTFYAYISEQKDACLGTANGRATVSYFSVDGHTNITYQWDANAGGQTTAEATGLRAGTYSVTVTDVEADPDLEDVVEVTIGELGYTFAGEIAPTSTSLLDCYGDSDGFIDVNITSAGEMPYSYSWNTGATTQDLINVGIGTYSITVTDANECEFTVTGYEITQPTEVQATAEVVSTPTCNGDYDGELTVLRSGGTEPYSYLWNDPGSQSAQNADGLDAGFYTVTVTDANGCHKSSSVILTEPDAIQVDKTVYNVSCHGGNDGAVQLAVSGGTTPFTYFWSTNDGSGLSQTDKDQSGLTVGNYFFTATDANNCLYEDSVEITEPETSLTVEITEVNDALCHGVDDGNIDITASGGTPPYIYAWTTDNGSGLVTDAEDQIAVGAGTYYLTVIDNNDCEANLSVTVNEPEAITIVSEDVVDATSEAASDGSITVEATGGTGTLSYTLTPGDEVNVTGVFENLSPDDYTIEITDENSCGPVTSNLTVSFPDAINSPSLAENIRLYPNPTSANLTVEIDVQQEETFTIEILNIAGQRLFKEITQANGKLKKELNLSDYAKGIYFIKISTEGFYYQEKVIFQ